MDNQIINTSEESHINNETSTNTRIVSNDFKYIEEFKKLNSISKVSLFSKLNAFLVGSKAKGLDEKSFMIDDYGLINLEEDLKLNENQSNEVFKNFKLENKIKQSTFNSEAEEFQNFSSVIDLCTYVDALDFNLDLFDDLRLNKYLNNVKNLGYVVLMIDMPSVGKLNTFFKLRVEKYSKVNYILKSLIVSKLPMMCLLYIQKFQLKTDVNPSSLKCNLSELIENNSFSMNKIGDLTFNEVFNSVKYIFSSQFYISVFKKVRYFFIALARNTKI